MSEALCQCRLCINDRLSVELTRKRKEEDPHVPEYDWEDLVMQGRRSREDPLWYKRPKPSSPVPTCFPRTPL